MTPSQNRPQHDQDQTAFADRIFKIGPDSAAQKQGSERRVFRRHELPCAHYYCAYPEATVTTVRQALALEPELDALAARAASMDPQAFEAAWASFLRSAQRYV